MSDYVCGVFFVCIVTKDDIKGSSRPEAVNVYSGSVHLFISVPLHWISLSTWGMGLEQIRAISDLSL